MLQSHFKVEIEKKGCADNRLKVFENSYFWLNDE